MKKSKITTIVVRSENLLSFLGSIALFLLMLITTANAILRYLVNSPIDGTQMIAELYLLPLITYFSFATLERKNGNISVTMLRKNLPNNVDTVLDLIGLVTALIAFGILTSLAIQRAAQRWSEGLVTSGIYAFPVWTSWAILSLGGSFLCLRLLIKLFITITNRGDE